MSVYLVNQREQIAAWVAGVSQGAETAEEAIAPAMAAPGVAEEVTLPDAPLPGEP
jgi:hypothetical protein